MIYPEISFIFFSLAVALFCVSVRSFSVRSFFLLIGSGLWYSSWGKNGLFIFAGILLINYFALRLSNRTQDNSRNYFFFSLTCINILIFACLKLLPVEGLDGFAPYGTSFFMLLILGFIIDLWRENKKFDPKDTVAFFTMPVFFPLLMTGPIERARHLIPQLKNPLVTLNNFSDGILIFSIGFLKKRYISEYFTDTAFMRQSTGNFLLDGLLLHFFIYVELSSYCDMGRGVAKMLGIDLSINFRPFYYSKNPNDFWKRWNITLGTWIRDYVTFPLMFKFGRVVSPNLIIGFSFVLIGLWHGLSLNWVVFGLFNGLIIYLYNFINKKTASQLHGYILSVCIWIGLGVLQNHDFMNKMKAPFNFFPSLDFSDLNFLIVAPLLILFFGFEYLQEKKEDMDFYLRWPLRVKYTLMTLLIIWFFYGLKMNAFLENYELPPIYFMI